MRLVWRLIRAELRRHAGGLVVRFLIAATVAAAPYGFSMLGRWLVNEALQVQGPPKARAAAVEGEGEVEPADAGISIEWRAKTTEEKLRLLGIFFAVSIGAHVILTALSALAEILNSRMVHRMTFRLRARLYEKLQSLDMSFFAREQVGQLMTRVLDDAGAIPGNLTNLVINFCTQVCMLALGIVLLMKLNPRTGLIALAALPFYALTCAFFLPRMKRNTEELRIKGAALNGHLVEKLSNVLTIKNYAQEQRESETFDRMLTHNLGLSRRQQRLNLLFSTLTTLITAGGTLAVLAFGFLSIRAQEMELGDVLASYQMTAQLFVPISALVGLTTVSQTLQVLAGRVYSVLDAPAVFAEPGPAEELAEVRGEIEFDGVSLRYTEGGPFAVQDLDLAIPAGATACIVGPTGCGKSTILTLLTRLYDPSEGVVRLDGRDIRELPANRLRRAIGNVLHDCPVFTGTLAENIAYGAPDASREEVEEVARTVGLNEFADSAPEGYDTPLGRGGVTLSATELARLGLARAIITRPAVLTIDDTYATIPEEVERPLRAVVRSRLGDRTILIASSRLSVCEDADMVVVMRKGQVIETGTHAELLGRPGLYRRMYIRQMGLEALEDEAAEGGS